MRKKLKIMVFSKMAPTIFIQFSGFIVHSKPNNITLSAFPGKFPETRKIVFNFPSVAWPNIAPKSCDQSRSYSISRIPLQISPACFVRFLSIPKIKGSSHKKKI